MLNKTDGERVVLKYEKKSCKTRGIRESERPFALSALSLPFATSEMSTT